MMCLNMQDTRIMIEFYRTHVAPTNIGVENMIGKIDYYEETEHVLSQEKVSNSYFLFLKVPQVPMYN